MISLFRIRNVELTLRRWVRTRCEFAERSITSPVHSSHQFISFWLEVINSPTWKVERFEGVSLERELIDHGTKPHRLKPVEHKQGDNAPKSDHGNVPRKLQGRRCEVPCYFSERSNLGALRIFGLDLLGVDRARVFVGPGFSHGSRGKSTKGAE